MLIEVLPVQSIVNGTAVTTVGLDELHKQRRRHKRDINKETLSFSKTHETKTEFSVSLLEMVA